MMLPLSLMGKDSMIGPFAKFLYGSPRGLYIDFNKMHDEKNHWNNLGFLHFCKGTGILSEIMTIISPSVSKTNTFCRLGMLQFLD